MVKARKGGFSKKSGERYPSGDLKPRTIGATPEQTALRAYLVKGGDQAMAVSPIRVLAARGVISSEEQRAAERYAAEKFRITGKVHPRAADYSGIPGGGGGADQRDLTAPQKYDRARAAMQRAFPRQHIDAWDNFVVYERFPEWIGATALKPGFIHELKILLAVMAVVADAYGATGPMSDAQANALGLGKSIDDLYAEKQQQ